MSRRLPDGWTRVSIGELACHVTSGSRGWSQYEAASGARFFGVGDLPKEGCTLHAKPNRFVRPPRDSGEAVRTRVRPHDILISITADLGRIGYIPPDFLEDGFINQHIALVRISDAIVESKFVASVLAGRDQRVRLLRLNDAGAKAGLNLDTIQNFDFPLPPVAEQRRIVAVLEFWDQAIETANSLTDARMRTLALARKLVFSDLSDAKTSLDSIAEVTTGAPAPQSLASFAEDGCRFVRVSDLAAFLGESPDEPEFLTAQAGRKMRVFPQDTIIFAKSGMSARLPRIARLPCEAYLVSHLAAVIPKHPEFQSFLYHWLSAHSPCNLVQGDGFPSIRISEVADLAIPGVGKDRAAEIGVLLDSLERDARTEAARADAFRTQKRGLMQKLLTGEWRVGANVDQEVLVAQTIPTVAAI